MSHKAWPPNHPPKSLTRVRRVSNFSNQMPAEEQVAESGGYACELGLARQVDRAYAAWLVRRGFTEDDVREIPLSSQVRARRERYEAELATRLKRAKRGKKP